MNVMGVRVAGLALLPLAFVAGLSGCGYEAGASFQLPVGGDYTIIYSDLASSEAGAAVVGGNGELAETIRFRAMDLGVRTNLGDSVLLTGSRDGNRLLIKTDGSAERSSPDYEYAGGATAVASSSKGAVVTFNNAGAGEDGYSNPILLEQPLGEAKADRRFTGYANWVSEHGGSFVVAGEDGSALDEVGSQVTIIDPASLEVLNQWRWPKQGGLADCDLTGQRLRCIGSDPEDSGVNTLLYDIDLKSGEQTVLPKREHVGYDVFTVDSKQYLLDDAGLVEVADDGVLVESTRMAVIPQHFDVDSWVMTDGIIDIVARDPDGGDVANGERYIGRLIRVDVRAGSVLRDFRLNLPDEMTTNIQIFPREFFTAV